MVAMKTKPRILLSLLWLLILLGFGVSFIQFFEHLRAVAGCESEGMDRIAHVYDLDRQRLRHAGYSEFVAWVREHEARLPTMRVPKSCSSGQYLWPIHEGRDCPVVVVCRRPHGVVLRWRTVLWSNGVVTRMNEREVQRLLRGPPRGGSLENSPRRVPAADSKGGG